MFGYIVLEEKKTLTPLKKKNENELTPFPLRSPRARRAGVRGSLQRRAPDVHHRRLCGSGAQLDDAAGVQGKELLSLAPSCRNSRNYFFCHSAPGLFSPPIRQSPALGLLEMDEQLALSPRKELKGGREGKKEALLRFLHAAANRRSLPLSTSTSSSSSPLSLSPPLSHLQLQLQQELDIKKNAKPIMYLFSRPGCSACDSLKSTLGPLASPALKALTKMFVVVHVQGPETLGDDKELRRKYAAAEFEPQGNYVPRAMFAEPKTGKVRAEIARPVSGENGAEFPHFVSTSGELESAMRHALVKLLGNGKGLKVGTAPGEPLKKVERRKKRQARKKQRVAASSSSGSGSVASRAEM